MSEIFDPAAWRAVDGFDFSDITYHRARDAGVLRIAFDRPEVRNAFRPGSPLVRTTVCLAESTRKVQPPGSARPVRSTRFTWKYPGWSGTGRAAIGRKRVSGARCRTSATAAAACASTVSMLMESVTFLRVTVPAEVEFGWDAVGFEVGVSCHRVPIPAAGSTTFTQAVDL